MKMPRRAFARVLGPFLFAPLAAPVSWLAQAQTAAQPAPANARTEAAKVTLVTGAVVVNAPDGSRRTPKVNDTLYEGDSIVTGADGELQAEMVDAGVIAVRSNTQMGITKYRAQGDSEDTSVFSLLKGSFRSITGWIGKNNPSRYQIATPTATIGVRGTDHEPLVVPEGSTEGEPGTYDKVSAGGSFIQNKAGQRVDVTQGRSGFFSQRGNQAPRLLDRVPSFYKPSRNEGRLEGLHDRIRSTLDQRRSERAQFVRTGVRPAGVGADRPGFGARNTGGQNQNRAEQRGQNQREQRQGQQQNRLEGQGRQGALQNRQNENRQGLLQNRQNENRQGLLQNRQGENRAQLFQNRQQQGGQQARGENLRQALQNRQQAAQQQRATRQNEREEKKRHN